MSADMSEYGYISTGTVSVDVGNPPSHADIVAGQVAELTKDIATHQNAITQLQRQIQELQAIEYKEA